MRKRKKPTYYYIEIRYFGKAKHHIRRIINDVNKTFGIRTKKRAIPHITLVQPFTTNNQKRVVSDFKRICSKYKGLMKFTVDGWGVFPFFVVFAKVNPDKKIVKLRHHLLNCYRKYARVKDVDRAYHPHTTIALKMGLIKFFRIWFYLKRKHRLVFTNHVLRITLLKGQKILYEYDMMTGRMLNRSKAKSRKQLAKTFRTLKKKK